MAPLWWRTTSLSSLCVCVGGGGGGFSLEKRRQRVRVTKVSECNNSIEQLKKELLRFLSLNLLGLSLT